MNNIQAIEEKIVNDIDSFQRKNIGTPVLYPKTEMPVDEIREFKDILSDFVTDNFFTDSRDIFIREVYSNVNIALTIYKTKHSLKEDDIIFVYKGGNILRLQYQSNKEKLPCYIYDQITNMYDKYFKVSDADFSVYINPKLADRDKHFQNVNILILLVLNRIRCDFETDGLNNYFDYYKFNKTIQKEIYLRNLLKNLNNASILKDPSNKFNSSKVVGVQLDDVFFGDNKILKKPLQISDEKSTIFRPYQHVNDSFRDDFFIREDISQTDKIPYQNIERSQTCGKRSSFYISDNDAIVIKSFSGGKIHFSLLRMKVNFKLYIQSPDGNIGVINVGGELIDITVPHFDDFTLDDFYDNRQHFTEEYLVTVSKNKDRFGFIGYNIEYIIHDLERMAFIDREYPWLDRKYEKRLNRLMLFYFLVLVKDYPLKDNLVTMEFMISDLKKVMKGQSYVPSQLNNKDIRTLFYFIYLVIVKGNNKDQRIFMEEFGNRCLENMTNFLDFFKKMSISKI